MQERLVRLEHDLQKVQGVSSARVVGDEEPSEIHIVSSLSRSPKQVVRDVQSLAAARFGMPIDHRIVSVVQLEEEPVEAPEAQVDATGRRAVLDRVVVASRGDAGWVKVALVWPDGETTEGAGAAGATRETRARGATVALLQAIHPVLERRQARVDVDHVLIHRIGSADSVLIRAVFYDRGAPTPLVGSAMIYDDVATAAVQALLQAVNRKLGSS
ncbi:MAG: hypothetical protein ABR529_11120 [Actinomycetota bacterium]